MSTKTGLKLKNVPVCFVQGNCHFHNCFSKTKKQGKTKIVSSLVCLWSGVRHVLRHQIACIHNGCLDKENRTAHSRFSHVNNLSTQTGKHKKCSEQNAGRRIWKRNMSLSMSAANCVWTEAQLLEDSLTLDVDGNRGLLAVGRCFVGSTAGDLLAVLDVRGRDVERADRAFSSTVTQQCLRENTNIGSIRVSWGSTLQMVNDIHRKEV